MARLGRFGTQAARDLGLDPDAVEVEVDARERMPWASRLPVAELALDSVALASAAIDRAGGERDGRSPQPVRVDALRVAASFGSERVLRIGGHAPAVWAPLSGFWRARDGWVRTHANYPHHAARLRLLLGVSGDADADTVAAALAGRDAVELESAAAEAGAIVAAVRPREAWTRHPQAAAVAALPLVGLTRTGDAPPRPEHQTGTAPLDGIRVLDLTRVIAGPVATRDLALAGADVLRVDSPGLPEPSWQIRDTGQNKRATLLDLAAPADRARFEELLAAADVLVTGYRPGALDAFGLSPDDLARTHPGLVVATLSAWGGVGPWGRRRGFDSIVQATIGIAAREARGADRPGALPAQALDHASGHLLAAAVAFALARRRREGGSWHAAVALARTGAALLYAAGETTPAGEPGELPAVTIGTGESALTCAPPVLGFAGAPRQYAGPVADWGADAPRWRR